MHSIQVHKVITGAISVFYFIGFWHRGDQPTARELRIKTFFWIYHLLSIASIAVGAIKNENVGESIFLAEVSIVGVVLSTKLWVFFWKQKRILDLVNRICVFSIRYDEDYTFVNDKFKRFMNFVIVFLFATIATSCFDLGILPFLGSEKTLLVKIAFPLDWKNNDFAFCIVNIFILTALFISITPILFTTIIWYLMLNCSLRYEVLGKELIKMGHIKESMKKKMSEKNQHNVFFQDLKSLIEAHLHLRRLINELETFCANLFFLQIATSSLCICGSIGCLAFNVGNNLGEHTFHLYTMFYNISEIFLITYFGNEIMRSSDRLSYKLFESNWIDQPLSTKKCILIFGEYLIQPHEFVVARLYPLTLELFTRILNSAYSMFNILNSFNQ